MHLCQTLPCLRGAPQTALVAALACMPIHLTRVFSQFVPICWAAPTLRRWCSPHPRWHRCWSWWNQQSKTQMLLQTLVCARNTAIKWLTCHTCMQCSDNEVWWAAMKQCTWTSQVLSRPWYDMSSLAYAKYRWLQVTIQTTWQLSGCKCSQCCMMHMGYYTKCMSKGIAEASIGQTETHNNDKTRAWNVAWIIDPGLKACFFSHIIHQLITNPWTSSPIYVQWHQLDTWWSPVDLPILWQWWSWTLSQMVSHTNYLYILSWYVKTWF